MDATTTARMVEGTVTAAARLLRRHKDYSVVTSITPIALRRELQALHRYVRDNLAMLVISIVMAMV